MFVIVGLGNPKREYHNTRHNIGFDVIDTLADKYGISVDTGKFKALIGKGIIDGQKVVLAKPLTFMNLSGESVIELVHFYKISVEDELIILSDDTSMDIGKLRIRKKGSAGGHNGLKNIIQHLNTMDFMRIKLGIGEKPKGYDLADYVLGHFNGEERKIMDETIENACSAISLILQGKVDDAMNQYNKKAGE